MQIKWGLFFNNPQKTIKTMFMDKYIQVLF